MKYLLRFSLVLSIAFSAQFISAQGIEFVKIDWQDAMAKAKEENKILFVDSYAEWCGPCKRMAKKEFVKEDVGSIYNENFINLKLDMESKNGRTFDSKYPVSAYPTMFYLDGNGKIIKKVKGGQKGDQLIATAKKVLKSHDTSGKYKEKYDNGDRSYEIVSNYVKALNKSGKPSLKISNDYIKSNPEITPEQKVQFLYDATVEADSKIFDKMVAEKKKVIELVGVEKFDNKIKKACQATLIKAIEYEVESLVDEAAEKGKNNISKNGEAFALELLLSYSYAMNNIEKYKNTAKELSKLYMKSDPDACSGLIKNIHDKFAKHPDMIDLSASIAKKYHKKAKNEKSTLAYAKSLMLLDKFDDAEKIVKKAIAKAEKEGEENPKTLKMMLNMINKKRGA